jgi:hypothetical protein
MKSGMVKANSTGPLTGKQRSLGGLVCTRSTSMIAPALRQSSIDLDMKHSVMQLTYLVDLPARIRFRFASYCVRL